MSLFWLPVSTGRDLSWLPHHVFLVQAIRNNEYKDMNLELAGLFRHAVQSHLSLKMCSFFFEDVLSLAVRDHLES